MSILNIRTYPDPVLKKVAEKVKTVTKAHLTLIDDMLETMYSEPGIGLAAPQVGESIRLIVLDTRPLKTDDEEDSRMTDLEKKVNFPLKLFNPVIKKTEGSTTFEEACLSVPGFSETVKRAKYVEVEAMLPNGETIEIKTDGLLAICLQHEIDHLEGKLYIDRISSVKRELIKAKIKKNGYSDPNGDRRHNL